MSFEQKVLLKKQIKTNLERLKKELTCQVCFRLFRDPQTLSCSHSYCKCCIKQLLQTSKDKGKFLCPNCRRLTSRREASHSDQMLAALVMKLQDFWDIIPPEIGCDALTQNTQYYNNFTVPKHMRASQILSKHRTDSIDAPNVDEASVSDSDCSQNTQHSHISLISNIVNNDDDDDDDDDETTTRRVTFNSNPEIETIEAYDKEEEESDDTTVNNNNHNNSHADDAPLYTADDLVFLSQNRPHDLEENDTINHVNKDQEETSSIVSDAELSEPMFSLDPDAHNMAGYTLDFGMDSIVEHDHEEEEEEEVDKEMSANEALHVEAMEIENENENKEEEDIEIKEEDEISSDKKKEMTQKEKVKRKPPQAPTLSVSTRSRRKSKKHKTTHLLQSKSFMASQCSQIVLDQEEENDTETFSKSDDNAAEVINNEDIDVLNKEIKNKMDIDPLPNCAETKPNSATTKPTKPRPKNISKRKKKKRNKKQKDQSKLEAIGLKRVDFTEGDFCSICCEDVDDIGVYCDGCDVFVHMQCYGITKKPTQKEQWFCDPCKRDLDLMKEKGQNMECVVCGTNTDCAYKAVQKSNQWAHTSCALWITGCNFVNKTTLSPIRIDGVDPDRYKLRCIFCKKRGGACLQCELCTNAFHVPCGLRGTAMLELRDGDGDRCYFHSFCPLHTDDVSRNSVPDNNHDFPLHPKPSQRGRKRKRTDEDAKSRRSKSVKQNKNKRKKRKLRARSERTSRQKNECSSDDEEDSDDNSNNVSYCSPVKASQITKSPDVRKRKLEHSAPVILCSKLTLDQIAEYDAFKEKFANVAQFTSQWKHSVTHLVTSANTKENKCILSARTIKYFQSVIAGCWVMCFDWIEMCLAKNTLINERKYEVLGDNKGRGACRKSRELRKNKSDNGLFGNTICVIASEFRFPNLDQDLRSIFKMGGAKLLKMLPYRWLKDIEKHKKEEMNGKNLVFVYDKGEYYMTTKQLDFCTKFGVLCIGYQQVFDTISNYKPISRRILSA